jgi:predicted nucleic acid-binding protein
MTKRWLFLSLSRRFQYGPISRDLVLEAIDLKQRFHISYWDAAIVAAAKQLGCATIFWRGLERGARIRRRAGRKPL